MINDSFGYSADFFPFHLLSVNCKNTIQFFFRSETCPRRWNIRTVLFRIEITCVPSQKFMEAQWNYQKLFHLPSIRLVSQPFVLYLMKFVGEDMIDLHEGSWLTLCQ